MTGTLRKLALGLSLLLGLAACNTVEGLGEDISNGARALDNAF